MSQLQLSLRDAVPLVEVLERVDGDHTARVVDVAGGADRTVTVLLDDGEIPLSELLARGLTLGQAATILVPLVECVSGLDAVGVVHGAIGVDVVRVDERGAPILGGFERARLTDRSERHVGRADHAALVGLVSAVLDAVEAAGEEARAVLGGAIDGLESAGAEEIARFGERLLEVVRPEPLALTSAKPDVPQPDRSPVATSPRRADRQSSSSRPPPSGPSMRVGLVARLRRLGTVRKRFWALGGGAVVAAAVGVLLLAHEPPDASLINGGRSGTEAGMTTGPPKDVDQRGASPRVERPPAFTRVAEPAAALRVLLPDVTAAEVIDDFGDVVLLRAESATGTFQLLLERTDLGWRLRDTLGEELPRGAR